MLMQPHDEPRALEHRLLGGRVDVEVGIDVVERAQLEVGRIADRLEERRARARTVRVGVRVDDGDHGRRSIWRSGAESSAMPAKIAAPTQLLWRNALKQPSRVRPRMSV